MAIVEGGEIGFDEGGVLQALNKEILKIDKTFYERNRKGEIIEETHYTGAISATTILFYLVLAYGPGILALFRTGLLTNPDIPDAAKAWWDGFISIMFPGFNLNIDPNNLLPEEEKRSLLETKKNEAIVYLNQLRAQGYSYAEAIKMVKARYP